MRRRRKSSAARSAVLWTICLALIGWGLYQAVVFWRALPGTSPDDASGVSAGAAGTPADGLPNGDPASPDTPPVNPPPFLDPDTASEPADPLPASEAADYPAFDAAFSARELSDQGLRSLEAGEVVAARFALNAALARTSDDDDSRAAELRTLLSGLNTPVFLGSAVLPSDPAARLIDIQEDDTFSRIAHAWGLTVGLLQNLNPSLAARDLKPHAGVKIVQGPFHARIVKHDHRLDLSARDLYVTSFHVDFPEGNDLPRGRYVVSAATKLQLGAPPGQRMWIGFHGVDEATEQVASGWFFGSAGPRGHTTRDLATGMQLADSDMLTLYLTLTEEHSHIRVEP
jgi:hypothetical protein